MFVGREEELEALDNLYLRAQKTGFQMAVVYGRRRVGKTRLLDEFARGKRALFFTAQQKNNLLNLQAFSRTIFEFFDLPAQLNAFSTWGDAFSFIADRARGIEDGFVFVFDEFPYAAEADPTLPSALQIAIDHELSSSGICMVLCGSNEGFMESEVLGAKSPLYGRRNAQIHVKPFDYYDAAQFLPGRSAEELVCFYATFGGTPYYLEQVREDLSYRDNVIDLMFRMAGPLYAEPEMLLRQEVREPAVYSSVLDAVALGAATPKTIAERAGMAEGAIGRYLASLIDLGIVERRVPLGVNPMRSRKGLHVIADPFFAFWYRFVSPSIGLIEGGLGHAAAARVLTDEALSTYVGTQFESVCMQWLVRQVKTGALDMLPSSLGKWWGADPVRREQVDVDVVLVDDLSGEALFGECKWRNSFNETEAIETLRHRSGLVHACDKRRFYLFTKREVSAATQQKTAELDDLTIVTASQLFE